MVIANQNQNISLTEIFYILGQLVIETKISRITLPFILNITTNDESESTGRPQTAGGMQQEHSLTKQSTITIRLHS